MVSMQNSMEAQPQFSPALTSFADVFRGQSKIVAKQVFEMIELCGIEAKNRYMIGPAGGSLERAREIECERACEGERESLSVYHSIVSSKGRDN